VGQFINGATEPEVFAELCLPSEMASARACTSIETDESALKVADCPSDFSFGARIIF